MIINISNKENLETITQEKTFFKKKKKDATQFLAEQIQNDEMR